MLRDVFKFNKINRSVNEVCSGNKCVFISILSCTDAESYQKIAEREYVHFCVSGFRTLVLDFDSSQNSKAIKECIEKCDMISFADEDEDKDDATDLIEAKIKLWASEKYKMIIERDWV